jgi:hypothetical protein
MPARNKDKISKRRVGILPQNTGETRRTQAFWEANAPRVVAIASSRSLIFKFVAVTDRIVSARAPKRAREARALPRVDPAYKNA